MNISKLGGGGALKSDTYNGARKTSRLIFEQVHEVVEDLRTDESDGICVLDIYSWNHLRNVCIGGMTKSLSALLGNTLR